MTEEIDLLSTAQVAEIAGISDTRVRQLIRAEVLPAVKLGKFKYVRRSDLIILENRKNGRPKTKETVK